MQVTANHFGQSILVCALLVGSAASGAWGDIRIFEWAKERDRFGLLSGSLLWCGSLILMGYLFKFSKLPFSTIILLLILAHFAIDLLWDVFREHLAMTLWQWIGVALGVAAIPLLLKG